jgi:hypothetical protein
MDISVVGVDLSKSVFQLSVADAKHHAVGRKRLSRVLANQLNQAAEFCLLLSRNRSFPICKRTDPKTTVMFGRY